MQMNTPQRQHIRLFTCDKQVAHSEQLLNIVCITCSYQLCCPLCLKESHAGHKFESLKLVVSEVIGKHGSPKVIKCESDIKAQMFASQAKQLKENSVFGDLTKILHKVIKEMEFQIESIKKAMNFTFGKIEFLNEMNTQSYASLKDSIYSVDSASKMQNILKVLKEIEPEALISIQKRHQSVESEIKKFKAFESAIYQQVSEKLKEISQQINHIIHSPFWQEDSIKTHSSLIRENGKLYPDETINSVCYLFSLKKFPIPIVAEVEYLFIYRYGKAIIGVCNADDLKQKNYSCYTWDLLSYQIYAVQIESANYLYESAHLTTIDTKLNLFKGLLNEMVSIKISRSLRAMIFKTTSGIECVIPLPEDPNLHLFVACQMQSEVEYLGERSKW